MFKKLKKEKQAKAAKNVKVEKLNPKELNYVVGGSINYNASKSNTGN
jgi:hypothetical protein